MTMPHPSALGPKLPLRTPRLILRDFVATDTPAILAILTHPKFAGYNEIPPQTAETFMTETLTLQTSGKRDIYRLAVCLKENPTTPIGYCVFHGWHTIAKSTNDQLGYFIHPEYQGHGYSFEAAHALLGVYFADYPTRTAYAYAHPRNHASCQTLLKLGFHPGETLTIYHGKTTEPRILYRLNLTRFKSI